MNQDYTVRIDALNRLGKSCKVAMVNSDSLLVKDPLLPILELLRREMIQGVCFSAVSKKHFDEGQINEVFARSEIIEIPYNDRFGATPEELLPHNKIRYLKLRESNIKFHISGSNFVELSLDLGKHISLGKLDNVKNLNVGKLLNWEQIPLLPSLESLSVVQSSITNLSGLARFNKLSSVGLGYLPKLTSFDFFNDLTSLQSFYLVNLSKKSSPELFLEKLLNLSTLSIKDCKFILPNLDFILPMPLKKLDIVRTEVSHISPQAMSKIQPIPWAYIKTKNFRIDTRK